MDYLTKESQTGKKKRVKRKRVALNGDTCFFSGTTQNLEIHEIYFGRNRQLSIDYGLVVCISRKYHEEIHRNPKGALDLELREYGRNHFEETYPNLDFDKIFV